jgi:5-(carboxyamino)imidazole ribonucleotide mutase
MPTVARAIWSHRNREGVRLPARCESAEVAVSKRPSFSREARTVAIRKKGSKKKPATKAAKKPAKRKTAKKKAAADNAVDGESRSPSSKPSSEPVPAGARVAVLMGSRSDWSVMKAAVDVLDGMGVGCDARVISAHRTPDRHHDYVTTAREAGIEVFICGAGFAAHLAGVTAALTPLPVLGVPLEGSALQGMDSLLATVQMPGGIPVATFGIGKAGAKNAGLFAAAILAGTDPVVREALDDFRARQSAAVPIRPE